MSCSVNAALVLRLEQQMDILWLPLSGIVMISLNLKFTSQNLINSPMLFPVCTQSMIYNTFAYAAFSSYSQSLYSTMLLGILARQNWSYSRLLWRILWRLPYTCSHHIMEPFQTHLTNILRTKIPKMKLDELEKNRHVSSSHNLSSSPSCPTLASTHKHIRELVKVQLG